MKNSLWAYLFCSLLFYRPSEILADSGTPSDNTSNPPTNSGAITSTPPIISGSTDEVTGSEDPGSSDSSPAGSTQPITNPSTPAPTDGGSEPPTSDSSTEPSTGESSSTDGSDSSTAVSDASPAVTTTPAGSTQPVTNPSTPTPTDSSTEPITGESPSTEDTDSSTAASTTAPVDTTTPAGSTQPVTNPSTPTPTDSGTGESSSTDDSTTPSTTTPVETTTPEITTPYHVKDRTSFMWKSNSMTDNPIVFRVPDGYYISVTVSDVDMSDGNYLLIEGGDSHSDDSTDGRVFANTVKGPLKYLFKTSAVYAFCELNAYTGTDTNKYDFTVFFERAGETTTSVTTTTTTPISVPPTEPNDSIYISVNVSGRPLVDYNNTSTREAFQECVALMARNYCEVQSIALTRDITKEYVVITDITQCPYNWPDSSVCVRIKFKLPIFYDESQTNLNGYQLKTNQLEVMWLRWDEFDEQCLSNHSFAVYTEPDVERSIMWWAIGISLVIVGFVILLWFLKTMSSRVKAAVRKNRSRKSDTRSILQRESVTSLTPHYLQDHLDTPQFFET